MAAELQQLLAAAASGPPPGAPMATYGWLSAQRLAWNSYRGRLMRASSIDPECSEVAHAVVTDLTRLCAVLLPVPGGQPPPRLPPLMAPSLIPKLSPGVRPLLHQWLLLLDARLGPLLHGSQRL